MNNKHRKRTYTDISSPKAKRRKYDGYDDRHRDHENNDLHRARGRDVACNDDKQRNERRERKRRSGRRNWSERKKNSRNNNDTRKNNDIRKQRSAAPPCQPTRIDRHGGGGNASNSFCTRSGRQVGDGNSFSLNCNSNSSSASSTGAKYIKIIKTKKNGNKSYKTEIFIPTSAVKPCSIVDVLNL
mmetsp:Transcript_51534/g.85387  ORF Transcript_51534/g.85387 Transcript_51534/m.85387 type:complete len:185 (-) Transcript_51534:33-587(-)